MGKFINGEWVTGAMSFDQKGRFMRAAVSFRDWITADGSSGYRAEPGRYHLYVSYACPWAHRTLIFRKLKGLEHVIGLSSVHPLVEDKGWTFEPHPDVIEDTVNGYREFRDIYRAADPNFTGRVTVPVLFDKQTRTIVNNESSEIIRMFNSAFDAYAERPDLDFWPADLREAIEPVNERVYHTVNNGVYRAGFARSQEAYEEAAVALFDTLDWLEERLATRRFLMGDRLTEADWRLFTTLVRFDAVYHGHFKCNLRRLVDYPNLWGFTRDLYAIAGVADTVKIDHCKDHYYRSHESVNPRRVVPIGPALDWDAPHGRERLAPGPALSYAGSRVAASRVA